MQSALYDLIDRLADDGIHRGVALEGHSLEDLGLSFRQLHLRSRHPQTITLKRARVIMFEPTLSSPPGRERPQLLASAPAREE